MINYLNRKNRAAGYDRLSKEDLKKGEEEQSESIINQKRIIQEYALKNGIEIYDFYDDDGYSGGNFDRPEFNRMLEDIEKGIIDTVIVKDISRLGREFIDTNNYIFNYFPEKGVRFISILDGYDSFNPNGIEDVIPYTTISNHNFLTQTSKKTKKVRHDLMNDGMYVGSTVPYGYKRSEEDNRKFVIDEYAAKIVERIFNLKKSGTSSSMIARTLTNEGILPPSVYSGKKLHTTTITTNIWKACTVDNILHNEVYIGTLIQGKFGRISIRSKKKYLLPESEWIIKKNNHQPIISEELFYGVNIPKQKNGITRVKKYNYLLKGLVVCAECGKVMTVRKVTRKNKKKDDFDDAVYCCKTYVTYRNNICSMHYYRESILNKIVIASITKLLKSYKNKEKLSKKYDEYNNQEKRTISLKGEISSLKNNIKTLEKAISDLYIDRANELITIDEFYKIKENLEKEKKNVEEKISELELNVGKSMLEKNNSLKDKIINDFLKMNGNDRTLIQQLVRKIEIDEAKNIKIYFTFMQEGELVNG